MKHVISWLTAYNHGQGLSRHFRFPLMNSQNTTTTPTDLYSETPFSERLVQVDRMCELYPYTVKNNNNSIWYEGKLDIWHVHIWCTKMLQNSSDIRILYLKHAWWINHNQYYISKTRQNSVQSVGNMAPFPLDIDFSSFDLKNIIWISGLRHRAMIVAIPSNHFQHLS